MRLPRERLHDLGTGLLLRTGLASLVAMRVGAIRIGLSGEAMARALWADRGRYDAALAFYTRYLRPGDFVIDAGANIGLVALTAGRCVGPSGRVLAAEPHPRTFRRLQANVRLNRFANIDTRNVALGEQAGTLRLREFPRDDSQNAIASAGSVEVAVVRLDALVAPERAVALLKVDVEGFEKFALAGATTLLPLTECVYFESWERHFARYGYTAAELFRWLAARGFSLYRLRGGETLTAVDGDSRSEECEDILAVRDVGRLLARTGYRLGSAER